MCAISKPVSALEDQTPTPPPPALPKITITPIQKVKSRQIGSASKSAIWGCHESHRDVNANSDLREGWQEGHGPQKNENKAQKVLVRVTIGTDYTSEF